MIGLSEAAVGVYEYVRWVEAGSRQKEGTWIDV